MNEAHFPMYYSYLGVKGLNLLRVNLLLHIANREKGSLGACTESASHMAELFYSNRWAVMREVEALCRDGYITKEKIPGRGWRLKTCGKFQQHLTNPVANSNNPVANSNNLVANSNNPVANSNTKRKGKEHIKEKRKEQGDKSPRGKAPVCSPFSSLPEGEVKEALMDYVEVRKGGKSPIKTERQEKLLLKNLEELSGGDTAKKVKIIEAATMAGWKMFYPLKEDKETRPPARRSDVDPWQGRLIPPQ